MKSYDEYKDSGIEWIGRVPKSWEMIKNSYLFKCKNGNGFPHKYQGSTNKDIPFYKVSDINTKQKYIKNANNYVSRMEVNKNNWNLITEKSILLAKIGEALRKNHRKINVKYCLIDNNMMALTSKQFNILYFYYLMNAIDMNWYTNPGAIPSVNVKHFKNDYLPYCSKNEQQKIASFLDKKTTAIDSIIKKKEKLIEKLEAYKKSVITEAVTKGKLGDKYINEDGELVDEIEMKDSGVEWIDRTPNYWSTIRLKFLIERENIKWNNKTGYRYIGLENIESGSRKIINTQNSKNITSARKFNQGDVLFGKLRPYLRKCVVPDFDGICTSELLVLRPKNIIADYLSFLMLSTNFIEMVNSSTYGAKMPRASWDFIGNINIPIPNLNIQNKISKWGKKQNRMINKLINETEKSIKKYKSYKKSLIYEAVTGKIDLRDYDEGGNSNVNPNNS